MKGAPGRRMEGGGRITREDQARAPALKIRVEVGNRAHQRLRVRVAGTFHDVGCGAELDDFSKIHHGDAIRDVFHHGEIVRDKNQGEMHFAAELGE